MNNNIQDSTKSNNVNMQQPVNNAYQQPVNNMYQQNTYEQPTYNESTPDKKKLNGKTIGLIAGGLALILIILGVIYCYFISNNSTQFYKRMVKKGVGEIFDLYEMIGTEEEKLNSSVYLDMDLDLEEGLIDKQTLDLLNKTDIGFNYQFDIEKEQIVFKVESDYDNESLFNLALFVDGKKEKTYLYAKDYLDSYLEMEVDDYSSFKELFEETTLSKNQRISLAGIEKNLKKELSNMISSDDCSKEDGMLVLEMTEKEFIEKLKKAINNLKTNKDFLECFDDENEAKSYLDELYNGLDNAEASNETIKISLKKKGMFGSKIKKLILEYGTLTAIFDIKGDTTTYEVKADNEKLLSGSFSQKGSKENQSTLFTMEIPELGSIKFDIISKYITGKDIDTIDSSNVKKLDSLTEAEMTEIMNKLENSKLYEFVELLDGAFGNVDMEQNENEPMTTGKYEVASYDGDVKVSFKVPAGYESDYAADTSKSFSKDDIEVNFSVDYCDSVDDCLEGADSWADYIKEDADYKNISLSPKKTKTVNGIKYSYKELNYTLVFLDEYKYYKSYYYTNLGNGSYLSVEISSLGKPIPESDLNILLSIKK